MSSSRSEASDQGKSGSGSVSVLSSAADPVPGFPFADLFPFRSRFYHVGPHKIHYVDEGTGPVLLLMHACPFWSFSFRNLILEFSRDHRVIALDQMGFGLSDKPADYDYRIEAHVEHLEQFIRDMDLNDITLIMHGRGTTIGMGYAVRHTENIRAFVTLNAMAFSDFHLPLRLQFCRFRWIGAKIILSLDLLRRGMHRFPPKIRAAYEYPFQDRASRLPLLKFIENLPSVPEDNSAQSMFEIESCLWLLRGKPAAIIWAENDWLYTKKSFHKWVQYFPKAEVHVIANAGRYLPEEAPDELLKLIREFLDSLDH